MDDRHGVHRGEHRAQLGGDRHGPGPRVGVVLGEVVGEVRALDVLHDEVEVLAVAARVVDRDQTGVVDLRGHPALADEASAHVVGGLAAGGAGDPVGAQELHRDPAVEALVVRRPDLPHATLAENRRQCVTPGDDTSVHRPSPSLRR
ncbi:hypothetical protein RKD45_002944 [Streptomyces griseus]